MQLGREAHARFVGSSVEQKEQHVINRAVAASTGSGPAGAWAGYTADASLGRCGLKTL